MGNALQDTNRSHQHPTQTDEVSREGNSDQEMPSLPFQRFIQLVNKLRLCDLSCGSENIPLQQPGQLPGMEKKYIEQKQNPWCLERPGQWYELQKEYIMGH